MANASQSALGTLRAITFRLTSTPDEQLPQVAVQLASSIWTCRELLSRSAVSKQESELSGALHRFKTYLATLLQHRNPHARWAGVVLVKATIEAGGLEVLSKSLAWVRHLLAILKRPDPPTTRVLAVVVLTRIFTLTREHGNLIREITTPSMPTFIATCLNNIGSDRCSARELEAVLEAFSVLLPHHPTLFRPHDIAIRDFCNQVLFPFSAAGDSSPKYYTEAHRATSRHLLALLHYCAPKQTGSEKWAEALQAKVKAAHATCDVLFRGVQEDWVSSSGVQPSRPRHQLLDMAEPEMESGGEAGVVAQSGWKGIWAGAHHLQALLQLVAASFNTSTSAVVAIRLGGVMDLLSRIMSVKSSVAGQSAQLKFHPQIMRDEKEALLSAMPGIQASAIRFISGLLSRFGKASASLLSTVFEQILAIAHGSQDNDSVRVQIYNTLDQILDLSGPSLRKIDVVALSSLLRRSCQDVLPDTEVSAIPKPLQITNANSKPGQQNGPTTSSKPYQAVEQSHPALITSARAFLRTALSILPATYIPTKTRTLIDRTAVLARDKDLLLASVLNPAQKEKSLRAQPSLLPFLARMFPDCAEAEALIRPRMPVLRIGKASQESEDEDEDEDEESDKHAGENDEDPLDDDMGEEHNETEAVSYAVEFARSLAAPQLPRAPREDVVSARPTETGIAAKPVTVQDPAAIPSAQKRPAEDFLIASREGRETTNPADKPSATTATKRARLSPPVDDNAGPSSLLDDLEAQLQGDALASGIVETITPSGGVLAVPLASIDARSDDDGSDFEMPPLTMEMDTDDEE